MPRSNASIEARPSGASRPRPYAEAARHAIVEAARALFGEPRDFAGKVDEVADQARVAPATVYAVIAAEMLGRIAEMDDPGAIVALVAQVCGRMREDFGDTVRLMISAAPHDPKVADMQAAATAQYRAAFVPVAQRLFELGALCDGMDVPRAVDVFWFYFGFAGLLALHAENCWSYGRTEQGLCEEVSQLLLRKPPVAVARPQE